MKKNSIDKQGENLKGQTNKKVENFGGQTKNRMQKKQNNLGVKYGNRKNITERPNR